MTDHLVQARGIGWIARLRAGSMPGKLLRAGRERARQEDLLENLFRASGRNLALAARFLPAAARAEGRLAFLICRALDAYEDLSLDAASARKGLRALVDYLSCDGVPRPPTSQLHPRDESDALDIRIAARLPLLRRKLDELPKARRARVCALVTGMARAMEDFVDQEGRLQRSGAAEYGERVLGQAVRYAVELVGLGTGTPVDHGAIGRVVQAANGLRDAEKDALDPRKAFGRSAEEMRLRSVLEALEASPAVPATLATLGGPPWSRARAAVSFMAITTASFFAGRLGARHEWLGRPFLGALRSMVSRRAFLGLCRQLDDLILELVIRTAPAGRGGVVPAPAVAGRRRSDSKRMFESALAMRHPMPWRALALQRVARLAHLVVATCELFPPHGEPAQSRPAQAINTLMTLDYLIACAARDVLAFGNGTLKEFCELVARLAMRAKAGAPGGDRDGDIAAFIAAVVARERGLPAEVAARWVQAQRKVAQELHALDERGTPAPMALATLRASVDA